MEGKKRSLIKTLGAPFNFQTSPIILSLTILSIIVILFRMKRVEQDYQYNDYLQQIEQVSFDNKELKAKKAKLLSVNNLRIFAHNFLLEQPKEHQIIIIP